MSALRDRDRASIRAYLEANVHLIPLTGSGDRARVLDFGSGKQPYRDVIEDVGCVYVPHDHPAFPASCAERAELAPLDIAFDAAICNQVIQYLTDPEGEMRFIRTRVKPGGLLLMTGPTNWPIVEKEDLWRFTPAGITLVLERAGWRHVDAEQREVFVAEGDARWPIGFQVKAWA